MLRIYLQQQWYSLSDPAMEEALIEGPTMRRFAGIDLSAIGFQMKRRSCPSATCWRSTIWVSRSTASLREGCAYAEDFVNETVKAQLSARAMTMRQGTIVDATLIAAPSSTFTRAKPECAGGIRK